jgi:histidine triad (HIT) family protein
MPSIFTKIIHGEIPCYKVAESEDYLAFLDINPLVKGHTLVIPKVEVDYIFDLDEETLSGLIRFAQKVAKGMKAAIACNRVGVTVIGLEVPHAHVHLIPINVMNDINFSNKKLKPSAENLADTAAQISRFVSL